MENNNNVLEIRGLNSYFFTEKGVAPAVDGLDLDIPKGKICLLYTSDAADE